MLSFSNISPLNLFFNGELILYFSQVGVGIDNDAVKVFHDHNVSIKAVEDLSILANQKLGGLKQWSLSSLVETFTCKQVINWYLLFLPIVDYCLP